MKEIVTNVDRLREIALDQYGYVTTSQALEEGVTHAALSMLVKRERLERVVYGVYRVPQVPATQYDRLMLAVLWTGVPEALLSHETALALYEVCDVNPAVIHVSVGRNRRIRRSKPQDFVVHYGDVDPANRTWWEQLPAVTLRKAIEECIDSGTPDHVLLQAIRTGFEQGAILRKEQSALRRRLEARRG